MSSLLDLLTSLSSIQLVVGLAITAGIVAIVIDWRLALGSVLVQYIFVTLLLATEIPLALAMLKLLAGALACLTLYWTARRMEDALAAIEGGRIWFQANRAIYPMGLSFRFLALLMTSIILFALPDQLSLTIFSRDFLIPALWLLAMGLLAIILTRDPLKSGLGLLTFQNGFELIYSQLENGLIVIGLLGVGTILVGLVASYLAIGRHLPLIEARRAELAIADPRSPEALVRAVAALSGQGESDEGGVGAGGAE